MSGRGKIPHRGVLLGSVAIAGGIAFGTYIVRRPHDNPLIDGLCEGAVSFNPWVRIDAGGITLITPHVELGRGAVQMQAMLIAEEMDLEPGQLQRCSAGPIRPILIRLCRGNSAPVLRGSHHFLPVFFPMPWDPR